jgi:hypothetical protein
VAFLVLAATAFALFRWNLSRRIDKALDAIRAQGYPVTLEELDAWYEVPPEGENAAGVLLDAYACSMPLPRELSDAVSRLFQGKLVGRTEPLPEHVRTLMVEYAAANETAFELLYQAGGMTRARWPIQCRDGFGMALPHHGLVWSCCHLLEIQALLSAQAGDADGAHRAMRASFGVAETLAKEPVSSTQRMRAGSLRTGVAGLERVLNHAALGEMHLTDLSARLEAAENLDSALRGIVGDRCMTVALARPEPGTEPFDLSGQQGFGPGVSVRYRLLVTLLYSPSGLADHDLLKSLETVDLIIRALALPLPARRDELARLPSLSAETHPLNLSHHMVWRAAQVMFESRRATAYLRTARLALAVERYRLAHGSLPETADELVPDFIDALPLDPYSDSPIRYKRLPNGFVTYSLASNRQDDGGVENADWYKAWQNGDLTFTVERE